MLFRQPVKTFVQSYFSTSFHRMVTHKQPHPEEHRPSDALGVNSAMRLEGWATTIVYPTLRDGPAGLLRVRLVPYQHSTKPSTSRRPGSTCRRCAPGCGPP